MKKLILIAGLLFTSSNGWAKTGITPGKVEEITGTKLTRVICTSEKSTMRSVINFKNGKNEDSLEKGPNMTFRLAFSPNILLWDHSGIWTTLWSKLNDNEINHHEEQIGSLGVIDASLVYTESLIKYEVDRSVSEIEFMGEIKMETTEIFNSWSVDRGTGMFEHSIREVMKMSLSGSYEGTSYSMISSEGICSLEKGKKF